MNVALGTYGLECYYLFENYRQDDNPLRSDINHLTSVIKQNLTEKTSLVISQPTLEAIYSLRIKGLKWLSTKGELDFTNLAHDIYSEISNTHYDAHLGVLVQNCLFAVRGQIKLANIFFKNFESVSTENIVEEFNTIPETYTDFILKLSAGIQNDEALQAFLDWINDSLKMEFGLVALYLLSVEKWPITDGKINELTYSVAEAAQDFLALSSLFFPKNKPETLIVTDTGNLSFDFITEQQSLAEEGLTEYRKNITEDEAKISKGRNRKR